MTDFTEKVISIIRTIPKGKVMTYGQIAALAGSPRGVRQVVRILHVMSRKHHLPWHRVINAKGEVSMKEDALYHEQILNLKIEGVEVTDDGIVNLDVFQWSPDFK